MTFNSFVTLLLTFLITLTAAFPASSASAPEILDARARATLTPSPTASIVTKMGVPDCHYQGIASTSLEDKIIATQLSTSFDPLECERACYFVPMFDPSEGDDMETCLSYQWGYGGCTLYSIAFDGLAENNAPYVIKDSTHGFYFSNRYPSDGSGFCYSVSDGEGDSVDDVALRAKTLIARAEASLPVVIKNLTDCHYQGLAPYQNPIHSHTITGLGGLPNAMICQKLCHGNSGKSGTKKCLSFSFAIWITGFGTCTLYSAAFTDTTADGDPFVAKDESITELHTATFYSNRYPSDGSDYCYSLGMGSPY